jgi:hypothetical protein
VIADLLAPVFGSATGHSRELLAADAAVRAALPRCRRIGFVQLAAGAGATTTAGRVVDLLARRRTGRILAVDASPSPNGLLPLLGAAPTRAFPAAADPPGAAPGSAAANATANATADVPGAAAQFAAVRGGAGTAADATAGLGRGRSGCYGLDLRSGRPAPADAWSAAVGPIARFYDVVVTDWGLRHPAVDLGPVLASSDVTCLVVHSDAGAVDATAALLHELAGAAPLVVALVGRPVRHRLPVPAVTVHFGHHRLDSVRLTAALMPAPAAASGDRRDP